MASKGGIWVKGKRGGMSGHVSRKELDRMYVDGAGNYRVKPVGETSPRGAPVHPLNKDIRREFGKDNTFFAAAMADPRARVQRQKAQGALDGVRAEMANAEGSGRMRLREIEGELRQVLFLTRESPASALRTRLEDTNRQLAVVSRRKSKRASLEAGDLRRRVDALTGALSRLS